MELSNHLTILTNCWSIYSLFKLNIRCLWWSKIYFILNSKYITSSKSQNWFNICTFFPLSTYLRVYVLTVCYCGKKEREVSCDGKVSEGEKFICDSPCEGNLLCGQHKCNQTCHEGLCGSCPWDPAQVTHCYCGKTPLTEDQQRVSCLDPIPTCGQVCAKQLPCGQPCKYLFHK